MSLQSPMKPFKTVLRESGPHSGNMANAVFALPLSEHKLPIARRLALQDQVEANKRAICPPVSTLPNLASYDVSLAKLLIPQITVERTLEAGPTKGCKGLRSALLRLQREHGMGLFQLLEEILGHSTPVTAGERDQRRPLSTEAAAVEVGNLLAAVVGPAVAFSSR
jgi:hypothetical protein